MKKNILAALGAATVAIVVGATTAIGVATEAAAKEVVTTTRVPSSVPQARGN